jgi:hypothetical protein
MTRSATIAKPKHDLIGKRVQITFGQHYRKQGVVLDVFPKDAARSQDTAMIKLNDGRIVSGVPVKDLQVVG